MGETQWLRERGLSHVAWAMVGVCGLGGSGSAVPLGAQAGPASVRLLADGGAVPTRSGFQARCRRSCCLRSRHASNTELSLSHTGDQIPSDFWQAGVQSHALRLQRVFNLHLHQKTNNEEGGGLSLRATGVCSLNGICKGMTRQSIAECGFRRTIGNESRGLSSHWAHFPKSGTRPAEQVCSQHPSTAGWGRLGRGMVPEKGFLDAPQLHRRNKVSWNYVCM